MNKHGIIAIINIWWSIVCVKRSSTA